MLGNRQVAWFTVWEFVAPRLATVGSWPTVGTPAWQELSDANPSKLAAVLDAGCHWALRVDIEQSAKAQAAQDVSAAIDWAAMARSAQARAEFYRARPWLKRDAS